MVGLGRVNESWGHGGSRCTYLGSAVPLLNNDTQNLKLTKGHKFSFPFIFLLLRRPKTVLLIPSVLNSHMVLFFFDPLVSVGQGREEVKKHMGKRCRLTSVFVLTLKTNINTDQLD